MNSEAYSFTKQDYNVYCSFLRYKGILEIGVPYKKGSPEKLEERNDKKLFSALRKLLESKNIDRDLFMKCAIVDNKCSSIKNVIDSYDRCYKLYKDNVKVNSVSSYFRSVENSIKYIDNYCLKNDISLGEYLYNGTPSKALQHWKEKKIDDTIIVYCGCLNKCDNGVAMKLYCKDLFKVQNTIKERIKSSQELKTLLKSLECS